MSLPLQQLLVGVVVGACAVFSAWRLLSLRLRLRVLETLAALPPALTAPWLAPLRARTLARLGGGCAGCAGSATPGAVSRNRTPGALRR
ncbi:MAG TPA: hypothetical protein VEU54_09965 [Steroidobacteraceae bacterium]|jgi:hypothetical protein|nr:hypothetical protein [Steroidobacteraceae bacterium]